LELLLRSSFVYLLNLPKMWRNMTKHTNSSDTTSTVVGPLFDIKGREERAAERGEIERWRKRGGGRERR